MKTQKHQFQSHNSPWTEVFDMHCQREAAQTDKAMGTSREELQPTHDALADVYNRE